MQPDVTLLAAFAVGFISFLSPCVLPLLPGYLSMLSGVEFSSLPEAKPRRILPSVLLFSASFTLVFVVLGLGVSGVGSLLAEYRQTLELVGGVFICLLGVFFVLSAYKPTLSRDYHPLSGLASKGGPVLTGFAFAIAWTPCIGPTLAAVLAAASTSPGSGVWLLLAYSLGLAIPFVLAALAFSSSTRLFAWFSRHARAVNLVSGALLFIMGVLIATGGLTELSIIAERLFFWLGLDFVYRL